MNKRIIDVAMNKYFTLKIPFLVERNFECSFISNHTKITF